MNGWRFVYTAVLFLDKSFGSPWPEKGPCLAFHFHPGEQPGVYTVTLSGVKEAFGPLACAERWDLWSVLRILKCSMTAERIW